MYKLENPPKQINIKRDREKLKEVKTERKKRGWEWGLLLPRNYGNYFLIKWQIKFRYYYASN